jgi:hypothetical protein
MGAVSRFKALLRRATFAETLRPRDPTIRSIMSTFPLPNSSRDIAS